MVRAWSAMARVIACRIHGVLVQRGITVHCLRHGHPQPVIHRRRRINLDVVVHLLHARIRADQGQSRVAIHVGARVSAQRNHPVLHVDRNCVEQIPISHPVVLQLLDQFLLQLLIRHRGSSHLNFIADTFDAFDLRSASLCVHLVFVKIDRAAQGRDPVVIHCRLHIAELLFVEFLLNVAAQVGVILCCQAPRRRGD
jgi:hypothetical protein